MTHITYHKIQNNKNKQCPNNHKPKPKPHIPPHKHHKLFKPFLNPQNPHNKPPNNNNPNKSTSKTPSKPFYSKNNLFNLNYNTISHNYPPKTYTQRPSQNNQQKNNFKRQKSSVCCIRRSLRRVYSWKMICQGQMRWKRKRKYQRCRRFSWKSCLRSRQKQGRSDCFFNLQRSQTSSNFANTQILKIYQKNVYLLLKIFIQKTNILINLNLNNFVLQYFLQNLYIQQNSSNQFNKFYHKSIYDFIFIFAYFKIRIQFKKLYKLFQENQQSSIMPTLYVCKNGKLVPRDPEKCDANQPKMVKYNHVVRSLCFDQCKCKEELASLKQQFETQLSLKDQEIQVLIGRIATKQEEIDKLERQISSLKNTKLPLHQTPTKDTLSIPNTESMYWDRMDKTLNSTIISNFSICDISQYQNPLTSRSQLEIKKPQIQMEQCFNKTNKLMNQIENLMKKKRTYEFHNPVYVENSIIQQLQNSSQKSMEQTQQINLQDTYYLPDNAYTEYDSLDITTNYESDHNFVINSAGIGDPQFCEKLLNDAIKLKNTIEEMRQQNLKQMKEMQEYYQKKIKITYEELQKQRQKNKVYEISKSKLDQITDKGRQILAQIDQEENFNWDVGQKFGKRASSKLKVKQNKSPKMLKC